MRSIVDNPLALKNVIPLNEESNHNLFQTLSHLESETPQASKILADARKLDHLSKYQSGFNYEAYADLERRYKSKPIRGGITFNKPFKLVNSHSTCQQCLYAFEIDTYGRGCVHECQYCYAKAQLTVHGYWNNPIPVPVDINEIRKVFYAVFETDKNSKWRTILEARIPLRIGSMTDSFMFMDKKYKVTQELLKILKFYRYPYVIFTRSDLVAYEDYISLLDKDLCAIQMSLSSINDDLNRLIEPGAPSAGRRLSALEKLTKLGFWTTVRINPVFPIYPDGYFTNPDFPGREAAPRFDFTSFEMVDLIADHNIPSFLVGFGRFSTFALNNIQKKTGINLKRFFSPEIKKSSRDWHFSDREISHYYAEFKLRAMKRNLQMTTCYIGYGESHFWNFQNQWSNKSDCCNIKGRVSSFENDSRNISFEKRIEFSNQKLATPSSTRLHDSLGQIQKLSDKQITEVSPL